ncbi:MAG: Kelch repeat-containing protein [Salinibacter sp.]
MAISRRRFLALGVAGTAAVAARPTRGLFWNAGGWNAGPPLPWATQEVYCTTWNEQIVIAGGLRSGADSDRRFATLAGTALLDPSRGTWTKGPDLPAPRHHIVLVEAGDTVYGFGGFVGETLRNGFQFRNDVYAFDGEQWARIGTMPTPLGETVALSHGGRIHLVTGSLHPADSASQGASSTHLVYEPSADVWTEARPVPTARSSATGAVINGHLYVAGGRRIDGGMTNLGALERYDPATDAWKELRPLPQPSGGLAGTALNGILYVFGGEYFSAGGGVYEHTSAYDPESDAWTERAPMRTPRHGLAGTALEGRVYAIGGNTAAGIGAATTPVVETLAPSED